MRPRTTKAPTSKAPTTTTKTPTKAPTTTTRQPTTTTQAPPPTTTKVPEAGGLGSFGEDISFLQFSPTMSLSFYYSVFSTKSYIPPNTVMYDIIPSQNNKPRMLSFARTPSIVDSDVRNGLFLGDNAIVGPLTSDMGINSGAFTIFYMCRFDNLGADADMIAFKLYGNTRDNNALTVRYSHVDKSSVIQTCKMSVRIGGDMEYYYCTIDNRDKLPFDKKVTYFFAIVVYHSSIEVHMASSLDPTFQTSRILQKDSLGSVVLSNKEVEINPSKNWNVYLKAFGGYDLPMKPVDLDKISMHLFLQEKNQDKLFYEYKMRTQQLESAIAEAKTCKFDSATCNKCSNVIWDMTPSLMMHADESCLKAINDYCEKRPELQVCSCWNRGSTLYDSVRCVNLRRWATGAITHDIKKLDATTLNEIMKRYKLQNIPPSTTAPPTTTKVPTTTTTTKRPTSTKPPTTTPLPTLAPRLPKSLTGVHGTNAYFDMGDDDDALIKYMAHNLKRSRANNKSIAPSQANRSKNPNKGQFHTHYDHEVDPLLLEDDEPVGFFGWVKNLFSSGVPKDDYPNFD